MDNENKTINRIYVEPAGYVHAEEGLPIEKFNVNGEMAPVTWYRKGNQEFNGKFVQYVLYNE